MPDYAGPLQRLVFSRTLWLIVAWPVLGCAWQVLVSRRRIRRAPGSVARAREVASARSAGLAFLSLAAVSTLTHAAVLARTPGGAHALFQHLGASARVGSLDTAADLWFDPLSATFCCLACLVALAAAAIASVHVPGSSAKTASGAAIPPPPKGANKGEYGWRTWAWLQLSLAGALVSFLADGFTALAVGWTLTGGAAMWLAGLADARAGTVQAVRGALATTAMVAGAVLLFWGLGGSWDGDEYQPEIQPRFVPVRVGAPLPTAGRGTPPPASDGSLMLTSAPGAFVFLDDARTPAARAPFDGLPVSKGSHTIRVRVNDGSADDIVGHVAFVPGEEIALIPVGPTLAFRSIADQLGVRSSSGDPIARRDMEARAGPGGAAVVAASMVAFLLAAWSMSGACAPVAAPRVLGALANTATTAMLGPYLLARLAFLFPLTPDTWLAIESIGAASLLCAGWYAPTFTGVRRWLAFVGVAPASLTWLALGALGVTAACYVAIITAVATAAFYLAASLSPNRSPREMAEETISELVFVRTPERLGALLASMDRWVVSPTVGALAALTRAGAWGLALVDEHVIAAPADRVASRMVRAHLGLEPILGIPVGRVAWAVLVVVGFAAAAYAFWPGG